jgi:hypothetical protein
LFGGATFLGYLHGANASSAPASDDPKRTQAIESVRELFQGFIEQFGDTDCRTLTGCDWSKPEDVKRYREEEIYKETCFRYFEYCLAKCVARRDSMA